MFLDKVGNRKVISNTNIYASTRMLVNLETVNDTNYDKVSMFMFYRKTHITGNDRVGTSDVQVAYI